MEPVPSTVTKTYPPRGPLQQYRFAEGTAFRCFRCGDTKKSKLITVYAGDWSRKLCNGCYGRLLSLYEIKAGTAAEDQRAEQLAELLLSLATVDQQREAERLFKASDNRASALCPEALCRKLKMLPKRYQVAHIFWSWVWILSIPAAFAVMYFYTWWAGLLLLVFLTPALSSSTKKSAMQFMIDHSIEDPEFYQFAVTEGVIRVRPKP